MKKFVFLLAVLLCCVAAEAQSMKMVVDRSGNVVGRLERVNVNSYTVGVQDSYDVPKAGHRVVTYSAAKGQGVVYRDQTRKGYFNVRKSPSTNSAVIAKIPDNTVEGYVPECYECRGKVNGWYKIRINGKVGYVRGDLMEWDGMCTF